MSSLGEAVDDGAGSQAPPSDSLFATVEPEWQGQLELLRMQQRIANELVGQRLHTVEDVAAARGTYAVGPTGPLDLHGEPSRFTRSETTGWIHSFGRRRPRRRRRLRRSRIERTQLVGRVVTIDHEAVGVIFDSVNGSASADEFAERFRLKDITPDLHSELRVGVVLELTVDRWLTGRGDSMSSSRFAIRDTRDFTEAERRRIERRADSLIAVIGSPQEGPLL